MNGSGGGFVVSVGVDGGATIEREFGSLERIGDQWPKAVIVHAEAAMSGRGGIRVIRLKDFLNGAG